MRELTGNRVKVTHQVAVVRVLRELATTSTNSLARLMLGASDFLVLLGGLLLGLACMVGSLVQTNTRLASLLAWRLRTVGPLFVLTILLVLTGSLLVLAVLLLVLTVLSSVGIMGWLLSLRLLVAVTLLEWSAVGRLLAWCLLLGVTCCH